MAGLDIVDAEAYTRRVSPDPRESEAVDLFWVRPGPGHLGVIAPRQIEQLNALLNDLLAGREPSAPLVRQPPAPAAAPEATIVRFLENAGGAVTTLEVETNDRSGLLLALSRALFDKGVQIVGSEVRTRGARVLDRFEITELDGSPIGEARRLEIQVAVLGAVDPVVTASQTPRPPHA
jgi:[protein-PII] uridylyltransferase